MNERASEWRGQATVLTRCPLLCDCLSGLLLLSSTEKAEKALASTPAVDLSLPKDGKIHINLGNKAKKEKPKAEGAAAITAGLGGLKLAPPPTASASSSAGADKKKDKKKEPAAGTYDEHAHSTAAVVQRASRRLRGIVTLTDPSLYAMFRLPHSPDDWVTF